MRVPGLLALVVLLAGCSSSAAPSTSAATPTATSLDAYAALSPPTAGALGGYDSGTVAHAQEVVHGLLAEQLLEPTTLRGASIAADLAGAAGDNTVRRELGSRPTVGGLRFRPLFAKALRLATPPATVVSSTWGTDLVQGAGGEQGLRVTWSGDLAYDVRTPDGVLHRVGYRTRLGYVFSALGNEPGGVLLQVVQPLGSTTTGTLTSCRARGVLWPGTTGPCPA